MLNRNIFERIILTRVKSIKATKLAHMYRVSYAKKSNNNFFWVANLSLMDSKKAPTSE